MTILNAVTASAAQKDVISVALYLRRYHNWSRWMLSLDGIHARVGRHRGEWCLEPSRALFRWVTRRRVPLVRAFPRGLRIRFLPSLKWRSCGSSLRLGFFATIFGGVVHATDILDMSELEGAIETSLPEKQKASFPVGEWVTVLEHQPSDMAIWVKDSEGTAWKLLVTLFMCVTDIEVDTRSIFEAWRNVQNLS